MSKRTNKIHLRLFNQHHNNVKTYCGIVINHYDTTRYSSEATCANCLIVFNSKPTPPPPPEPTKHNSDQTWNIHQEKKYLDHLGTGKWSRAVDSRQQLLQSYINTIDQRQDRWVKEAKAYAIHLLQQEQATRR